MGYFDSHAHYWDRRFDAEWEGGAAALIRSAFAEGVSGIVNVGTSPETSWLAIAQAKQYPRMFAAAGIHPSDAEGMDRLDASLAAIEKMFSNGENKLVALGEIGLDYHYEPYDREVQLAYFHGQMALAAKLGVPVLIHDREAHGDCFDVVSAHPDVRGVFHSYSGSAEMARDLVAKGYYISFSGTVSFTNAKRVAQAAAAVPRDRLLIETDCPYLAPHPFRGKLNHSGLLPYTARAIAEIWGCTEEEVAEVTEENARRFFGLDG